MEAALPSNSRNFKKFLAQKHFFICTISLNPLHLFYYFKPVKRKTQNKLCKKGSGEEDKQIRQVSSITTQVTFPCSKGCRMKLLKATSESTSTHFPIFILLKMQKKSIYYYFIILPFHPLPHDHVLHSCVFAKIRLDKSSDGAFRTVVLTWWSPSGLVNKGVNFFDLNCMS